MAVYTIPNYKFGKGKQVLKETCYDFLFFPFPSVCSKKPVYANGSSCPTENTAPETPSQ